MSYINPRYTQMKEENDAMNSLLIERDAEIEKLKEEVKRIATLNWQLYGAYKDLKKEKTND